MHQRFDIADLARRRLERFRERRLNDPAYIAELEALRAKGINVVHLPGLRILVHRYLSGEAADGD